MGSDRRAKVLVIGLDGGTYTVLDPLARAGLVPNLARLMETGAKGVLRSTVPPISAPAWATFQTGKNPGKHGLFNFFDLSETGFRQSHNFRRSRVVNHANIRSATIYDYLREGGRSVISVNIPLTYPTPEVPGAIVSCWLTPPGSREYTFPRELVDELPDYRIDQNFGEGMYALTPAGPKLDSDFLFDDLTDIAQKRADAAAYLLTSRPWDVAMVCFTETDRLHHYFWRAINPEFPGYDTPEVAHERARFEAFYRDLDGHVGRLIEAAGEGVDVMVVSDHGFDAPPSRRYNLMHWMQERGWVVTRPAPAGNGDEPASDAPARTPAVASGAKAAARALWQRLVPPSLRDQVYARTGYRPVPQAVDWERTRAWSFGVNNNLGAVCINERDDAGNGCVPPGPEVDRLAGEIAEGLRALKDPRTGRPVVQRVARREELYEGPYRERFPHLMVWLDPDFEADYESGFAVASHRIPPEAPHPNGRGNHREEGICIAAGPDIVPGAKADEDLASIMPTLLHMVGLAVPDDLDGRVMTDYLVPEARQVRTTAARSTAAHRFAEPSKEDVERLQEKLRQLGYM